MVHKSCKGCGTRVARPILCVSCGIAAHPGCISRVRHPHANGQFLNCSNVSPSLTTTANDQCLDRSSVSLSPTTHTGYPLLDDIKQMVRQEMDYFLHEFREVYKADIEKIKTDIAGINMDIAGLSDRITALEIKQSSNTQSVNHVVTEDEITAEVIERDHCSRNLILFNLEETDHLASSSSSTPLSDQDLVQDIFRQISPSEVNYLRIFRIGSKQQHRPRPLKVSFSSKEEAISLLRNKKKYNGPVSIMLDRTRKQREHLKNLKAKLKSLIDSGLTHKTIKYFNGVPKIVDVSLSVRSKKKLASYPLVYFQNVRGLRSKLSVLRSAISTSSTRYDVIILVETWLCNSITNAELGLDDFVVYRLDRNIHNSIFSRGGGVLIAVRRNLASRNISLSTINVEQLFVLVQFRFKPVIIGTVYLPPGTDMHVYESHCKMVEEIILSQRCSEFLIAGDYNLARTSWKNNPDGTLDYHVTGHCPVINQANTIFEYYNLFQFRQFNFIQNSNGSILDLVFSSFNNITVSSAPEYLIFPDVHHPPLHFHIPLSPSPKPNPVRTIRKNFYKANYRAINNYLGSINWDSLFLHLSADEAVGVLSSHINFILDNFIPSSCYIKSSYPSWFSRELISLLRLKKQAHRQYKRTLSFSDYLSFSGLRTECKRLSLECWSMHAHNAELSFPNNAKAFWKFIDSLKRVNPPSSLHYNDKLLAGDSSIANGFAEFFESVYTKDDLPSYNITNNSYLNTTVSNISVDISEVLMCIDGLSLNTGPGLDGLPPVFFKECRFILSRILWLIFNKSLSHGVFPEEWKLCVVKPIPKNADNSSLLNFRPICIQNIMPKIFENIVTRKLSFIFKNIIIPEQHGFLCGRSTVTNLTLYHHYLTKSIEDGAQVDVIYTDFHKAFDSISHSVLLSKLHYYGISGNVLSWLTSFITNRHQIVRYNNSYSNLIKVTSGVPQGSHLGPLLFNLAINDISHVFQSSKFLLYADDLKIYRTIDNQDSALLLQADLLRLQHWCSCNNLKLNLSKCHVIRFSHKKINIIHDYTLDGVVLQSVSSIRDLGVTFSSNLTFTEHYSTITAKALRTLGYINRVSKDFKNPKTLIRLYCALVRPLLEYCSLIWSPYYKNHIASLESVQHKFLRLLAYRSGHPLSKTCHDYNDILYRFNMTTLINRRKLQDILFVNRVLLGRVNCSEIVNLLNFHVPIRSTRNHCLFYVNVHRTLYGQFGCFDRALRLANEFSSSINIFTHSPLALKDSFLRIVKN